MEKRIELTCINCPMGCPLTVIVEDGKVKEVKGYTCKRGRIYGEKEVTAPSRIVTSTVPVSGGTSERVSVKTEKDIPKDMIFPCIQALKKVQVHAPVAIGDVILENAAGTGVNVIATKNVLNCER